MSNKVETVGSRIKQVRGNLSQASFATKIGVNKAQLGKYERDENIPGGDILTRLYEACGTDITWLLTGEETTPSMTLKPQLPAPSGVFDEDLMDKIGNGISSVYKEENARIGPGQLTRLAARLYGDLADFPLEERPIALKGILTQLRRDLRQSSSTITEDKRLA